MSREVQGGPGVTCLEGRALTHSHKSKDEGAGRRAELRRAAGLLHHQPAEEAASCVVVARAEEHI